MDSVIDEIKNRLDIVEIVKEHVKLQKSGVNYRALCPFHSEKTPSFFVNPARQIWHCFGSCSEGGDIFKFIMKIEGVEFGDALRILAARAGVQLKKQDPRIKTERQRAYEICEWAARFFQKNMESFAGKRAEKYLTDRKITKESIEIWRIGYAPNQWDGLLNFLIGKGYSREEVEKAGLATKKEDGSRYYDKFRGRIIFPVFDFSSQPIGFGGRIFDPEKKREKEAKYLNTPNTIIYDKSRVLYGLHKARHDIGKKDFCVLVEGYTDVIMSCQAGIENVVSTSGTALTPYQLEILRRYSDNLVTAFDMDIAGGSATEKGIEMAQKKGFDLRVALMEKGLDPADLAAKDSEKWKRAIENSVSITAFYFETAFTRFNSEVPEEKKKIAKIVLPAINRIPSNIEKDFWIQELAKKLKIKESAIIEDLRKIKDDPSGIESVSETESRPEKKNRKDLLEGRLLVLLVKNPQSCQSLASEDLACLSREFSDIIGFLKEKKGSPPPEIKEKIDYLNMKGDAEGEIVDAEKELSGCLHEIRVLRIKEDLSRLSEKIKEAEENGNSAEMEGFKKEFNLCCKKLMDIN